MAQNAADGDDNDVAEEVFAIARMARIGEGLKVGPDRLDIDELRHGNILEIEENRHANTFRVQRPLSNQRYGAPTQGARSLSYPVMRAGLGDWHLPTDNAFVNNSSTTVISKNLTGPRIGHTEIMLNVYAQIIEQNQTLSALNILPFKKDPLVVTTPPPGDVTAGAPFGLTGTAENSDGSVNTAFDGQVTVALDDSSADLGGTLTVTAVNGIATFTDLTATRAGSYTLLLSNPSVGQTTTPLNVTAAAASHLAVTAQPTVVTAHDPFDLTVAAEDPNGNVDSSYSGNVTLSLQSNLATFGATLGGTLTAAVFNGVATFTGLTSPFTM